LSGLPHKIKKRIALNNPKEEEKSKLGPLVSRVGGEGKKEGPKWKKRGGSGNAFAWERSRACRAGDTFV